MDSKIRMTPNRTSQAVENVIKYGGRRFLIYRKEDALAICEKYKRMEEALQGIRDVYGSFPNQKPENKLMNLDEIAKRALSFDPLA